jgi:diguanylate cyclase (GGDEF)-like protein
LSAFNLLLITAAFCVVTLLVLCSLLRSGIQGVREWSTANAMAVVALLLFAARGVAPPFVTIELANALLLGTTTTVLVGVRRFFSRTVPAKMLGAGLGFSLVALTAFHYGFDSIQARTVIVSIFHSLLCFVIAITVLQSKDGLRSRYPYFFMAGAAFVLGLAYGVRALVYGVKADVMTSLFQPSFWNLLFLSVGTLAFPILTLGAVMMVHDRMMARAEDAANRDFLTGAWSRRALFETAERELARAARTGRKLSLLLFDVDYFKIINDTHGHATGDQVLIDIALKVGPEIRSIDCFARIGGEEFAVLLPETELSYAFTVAERLRETLERQAPAGRTTGGSATAGYTVSIGVAALQDSESFHELMRRADAALYRAKASGRNLVVASQS